MRSFPNLAKPTLKKTLSGCESQTGVDIEDCIHEAYEVIKNRTGKMAGGVFVREV